MSEADLQAEGQRLQQNPFGTTDVNGTDVPNFDVKQVLKEVMDERNFTLISGLSQSTSGSSYNVGNGNANTSPYNVGNENTSNSPYNVTGNPGQRPSFTSQQSQQQPATGSGANIGTTIFGALIFFVGLGITFGSDGQTIAYGAILVGLVTMIRGLVGD